MEVTVVIPTRDRRELLTSHALPSALGQEDVELEVIVVDDGSSHALSGLAGGDPRVRVVQNSRAPGVAGARNSGIDLARGAWIAFLDDDDLWAPQKLRAQLDAVDGASWIFSEAVVIDDSGRPLYSLPLPEPEAIASALLLGNVIPSGPSNVVANASFLRAHGGFDETLVHHTEDWDLWLRLAQAERPAICRAVHVASLEHTGRSALGQGWAVVQEAERLLAKHGPVHRRQLLSVAEWLAYEQHTGGHRKGAAALYLRAALTYRSPSNLLGAAGALLGRRGMSVAAQLLQMLRGRSHLAVETTPVVHVPAWLHASRIRGREQTRA